MDPCLLPVKLKLELKREASAFIYLTGVLWYLAASMFDGTEHGFKSVFYLRYRMPGPCVLLLFILVKPRNIASES